MDDDILKWHIIGIVFISIVGSIFHFIFEWSGYWPPVGAISAVNESVWEHLKLTFWPLVFFSLIEFNFIRDEGENKIIGKTVAAYLMPITIVAIFYSYEAITGAHSFIVDISSFFIAVVVGQFASFTIMKQKKISNTYAIFAWILIILLGTVFVLFTYFPPQLEVFRDSTTGKYGIIN